MHVRKGFMFGVVAAVLAVGPGGAMGRPAVSGQVSALVEGHGQGPLNVTLEGPLAVSVSVPTDVQLKGTVNVQVKDVVVPRTIPTGVLDGIPVDILSKTLAPALSHVPADLQDEVLASVPTNVLAKVSGDVPNMPHADLLAAVLAIVSKEGGPAVFADVDPFDKIFVESWIKTNVRDIADTLVFNVETPGATMPPGFTVALLENFLLGLLKPALDLRSPAPPIYKREVLATDDVAAMVLESMEPVLKKAFKAAVAALAPLAGKVPEVGQGMKFLMLAAEEHPELVLPLAKEVVKEMKEIAPLVLEKVKEPIVESA